MSHINVLVDRWDKDDRSPPGAIGPAIVKEHTYIAAFHIMKQIQGEDKENLAPTDISLYQGRLIATHETYVFMMAMFGNDFQ